MFERIQTAVGGLMKLAGERLGTRIVAASNGSFASAGLLLGCLALLPTHALSQFADPQAACGCIGSWQATILASERLKLCKDVHGAKCLGFEVRNTKPWTWDSSRQACVGSYLFWEGIRGNKPEWASAGTYESMSVPLDRAQERCKAIGVAVQQVRDAGPRTDIEAFGRSTVGGASTDNAPVVKELLFASGVRDGRPVGVANALSPDANSIYIWIRLDAAQYQGKLKSSWYFLRPQGPYPIGEGEISLNPRNDWAEFNYALAPGKRWPVGEYKVVVSSGTREIATGSFRVAESSQVPSVNWISILSRGNPVSVLLDAVADSNDKNWPLGTIKGGERYTIEYLPGSGEWSVTGYNKGTRAVGSWTYPDGRPEDREFNIWGHMFRFDDTGRVLDSQLGHVGRLVQSSQGLLSEPPAPLRSQPAGDFSGNWTMDYWVWGNPRPRQMVLTQQGSRVTGSMSSAGGNPIRIEGTLMGDTLILYFVYDNLATMSEMVSPEIARQTLGIKSRAQLTRSGPDKWSGTLSTFLIVLSGNTLQTKADGGTPAASARNPPGPTTMTRSR
ncbi:MAG: hypothetical protein PHQ05_12925 [Sterolibacterium sp.]|nr:hypothetical protein [Sterolibacterium sp.]